jgi:hypothetical protein
MWRGSGLLQLPMSAWCLMTRETGMLHRRTVSHANDWASQIVIGQTDTFEHGSRTCTVTPIRDNTTAMLGINCHSGLQMSLIPLHGAQCAQACRIS